MSTVVIINIIIVTKVMDSMKYLGVHVKAASFCVPTNFYN